tara:strand:+ start:6105 stop:6293 length:189 start_codon:yes stop_codon:yes gene_type:complete
MKISPWAQPTNNRELYSREDIAFGSEFQAVIVEPDGRTVEVLYSSDVAATVDPLRDWIPDEI